MLTVCRIVSFLVGSLQRWGHLVDIVPVARHPDHPSPILGPFEGLTANGIEDGYVTSSHQGDIVSQARTCCALLVETDFCEQECFTSSSPCH